MSGHGWRHLGVLAAFLVASFAAALIGSAFPPGEWYAQIAKPSWTPPGWLFGPVWTVLYILIGVAGWLVWKDVRGPWRQRLVALWAVQMVLNAAWSWLFFGLRRPDLALVDIGVMVAVVASFIVLAWPRRRLAGVLFVPYLAWIGFATALNASIWWLNR